MLKIAEEYLANGKQLQAENELQSSLRCYLNGTNLLAKLSLIASEEAIKQHQKEIILWDAAFALSQMQVHY